MNKKVTCVFLTLIIICTILLSIVSTSAATIVEYGDFELEIPSSTNTTEYYLNKYIGMDLNVEIPEYIGRRKIVQINRNAFYHNTTMTSCVIPETIEVIGTNAFFNCTSLTSITIPNSVTSMKSGAFGNCTNLTSVLVDNSQLKSISASCFLGNSNLMDVVLCEGLEKIYTKSFKDCTSLEKLIIPSTVNNISEDAFDGCDKLIVYVYDGSYALQYAIDNNIPYVNLGAYVEPTEPTTATTVATEATSSTAEATSSTATEATSSTVTDATEATSSTATDATESTVTDATESTSTEATSSTSTDTTESTATDPSEEATSSTATEATASSSTDASESVSTSATVTSTQSTSSTGSTENYKTYLIGDVDLDGRITIKDATKIQKHIAKLLELSDVSLKLADANNDLKVSVKDATQIQKFIAGFKGIEFVGTEVKL